MEIPIAGSDKEAQVAYSGLKDRFKHLENDAELELGSSKVYFYHPDHAKTNKPVELLVYFKRKSTLAKPEVSERRGIWIRVRYVNTQNPNKPWMLQYAEEPDYVKLGS